MNISRQYKLYRLGVEVPPTSLEIISLVEGIFDKLIFAKNDQYPDSDFYIDTNDNNKVYMENPKNGYLWCRYEEFWQILQDKYQLNYNEIQGLIKSMMGQPFKRDGLTPIIDEYNTWYEMGQPFKLDGLTPETFDFRDGTTFQTGWSNTLFGKRKQE